MVVLLVPDVSEKVFLGTEIMTSAWLYALHRVMVVAIGAYVAMNLHLPGVLMDIHHQMGVQMDVTANILQSRRMKR